MKATLIRITGPTEAPIFTPMSGVVLSASDALTLTTDLYCLAPATGINYSYPFIFYVAYEGMYSLDVGGTSALYIVSTRLYGPGIINAKWFPNNTGRIVAGRKDPINEATDNGFLIENYIEPKGIPGVSGYAIKDPDNGMPAYNTQSADVADIDMLNTNAGLLIDSRSLDTSPVNSKAFVIQAEIRPRFIPTKVPITIEIRGRARNDYFSD
jgi:hypothetical protein